MAKQSEGGRIGVLGGLTLAASLGISVTAAPASAAAGMYGQDTLVKDWPRLKRAVTRIYREGLAPVLTADERRALKGLEIEFPLPQDGDELINFYAAYRVGRPVIVMPILSLKVLEDMTTAYAWLTRHGHDLGMIELCMTMTRYRPKTGLPGGRMPPILAALGVPSNALDDPKVDRKSLSLRNGAFAFLLAHEIGHIRFRHQGYSQITKAQARADEVQSDHFALDLLERTRTAPVGGFLYFQAQIYRLPHRSEFQSKSQWQRYLAKTSTHPMSSDRLNDIAGRIERWAWRGSAIERVQRTAIALGFKQFAGYLTNLPLQRCMLRIARKAPLDVLKPGAKFADVALKHC